MTADPHLIAVDPDLAPLWQTVHDRLSAGSAPADIATVTVPDLTPGAVAALRSWLDTTAQRRSGRTCVPQTSAGGTRVPVRALLTVLGLPVEALQPLVERAVGRGVVNRKNHRLRSASLRQELWQYAETRLPHLPQLRARMKSSGLENGAVEETRRLIDSLADLTRKLPSTPPRALAKLAHDHAGDPHYFDLGTLPGQRLISAIAELTNQPEPSRPDHLRTLLLGQGIIADGCRSCEGASLG
ncbi:TIGR02679 domain-containing protein [Streptomyces sp. NPDC097617]|uniref:TIGR02679 domain-containing protein n=1 Tax=Streptomyces sp. NPDC097617 TaxID=3366091 RepID=UPI003829F8B5